MMSDGSLLLVEVEEDHDEAALWKNYQQHTFSHQNQTHNDNEPTSALRTFEKHNNNTSNSGKQNDAQQQQQHPESLEPDGTDLRFLEFLANQRTTRHTGRSTTKSLPQVYVPNWTPRRPSGSRGTKKRPTRKSAAAAMTTTSKKRKSADESKENSAKKTKTAPQNVFEFSDELIVQSESAPTSQVVASHSERDKSHSSPPPATPSRLLLASELNISQCSPSQTVLSPQCNGSSPIIPRLSSMASAPTISIGHSVDNPLNSMVSVSVLDGESDELLFSDRGDCLPFPEWDVDPSNGECAEIPIYGLTNFKSTIEKKLEKENSKRPKPTPTDNVDDIPKTDSALPAQPKPQSAPLDPDSSHLIQDWKGGHYINCDLRYFNLSSIGNFDVVLVDPPWRINGANRHFTESNMFSNNKFNLDYNTLSNQEIIDINVGSLSDHGFCFLWVINSALQLGLSCLNQWGYTFVDRLTWVKRTKHGVVAVKHGYYFLHSSEICLVGVKYKKNHKLQYISKVTNDVIFGDIRKKSQKPDELYQIIERMMPGGRKIELFAKNHNIRPGWLSLGNRLGPNYDTDWMFTFTCDVCNLPINPGKKRFKSKLEPNKDLCAPCLERLVANAQSSVSDSDSASELIEGDSTDRDSQSSSNRSLSRADYDLIDFDSSSEDDTDSDDDDDHAGGATVEPISHSLMTPSLHSDISAKIETRLQERAFNLNDYFELQNAMGEVAFHDWYTCDICKMYPICGVRFSCKNCSDFDVCEGCFDSNILGGERPDGQRFEKGTFHPIDHEFEAIEYPNAGDGFAVHHRVNCHSCHACPIIGERMFCSTCGIDLCRKCFFMSKEPKGHLSTHQIVLIPETLKLHSKNVKCAICKARPIQGPFYKCNICLNFDICASCFPKHDQVFPCELYPAHKRHHKFTHVT